MKRKPQRVGTCAEYCGSCGRQVTTAEGFLIADVSWTSMPILGVSYCHDVECRKWGERHALQHRIAKAERSLIKMRRELEALSK